MRSLHISLITLALALSVGGCPPFSGCERPARNDTSAPPAASASASAKPSALTEFADIAARDALEQLEALQKSAPPFGPAHPAYLTLRRTIASATPLWRRRATMGGGVLFGPRRSINEAGGALLALDTALRQGNMRGAARAAAGIQRSLTLIRQEVARNTVSLVAGQSALSEAAYLLGAMLLESTSGLPESPEAVLADLRGTMDFLERGTIALIRDASLKETEMDAISELLAPLRKSLDEAKSSLDLHDRASLVLVTGQLGVALRRLAISAGLKPHLPYSPRFPLHEGGIEEPVNALTLPAPRSARPGAPTPGELSALGKKLFFEKLLSKDEVRSCASCHDPTKGFSDGLARPKSLDPQNPTLRNTPTLLYTSLHAVQMWDGRTLTAEKQAIGVIHAPAEMGLSPGELLSKVGASAELKEAFASVPGGLSEENVARALADYEVKELVPGRAPIDRFARGEQGALSADARKGLDVFAGKGRCGRCHVPPLFGGSRPLDFAVPVFSVLGVPKGPKVKELDPDLGRALVTKKSLDERAFKTPTVRDIARTGPYFHNGGYKSLAEVVDFYNRGGGKGLGLDVPNQDPDVRVLDLSAEEIRVLLVLLNEALLDSEAP